MSARASGRDTLAAVAALMAAAAVAGGAYGAHGLHVDASIKAFWETAVAYQMWHCLGAFAALWVASRRDGRAAMLARLGGWLMIIGTALFSGALYVFVLDGIVPVQGMAPMGGMAMIAGWVLVAVAAFCRAEP